MNIEHSVANIFSYQFDIRIEKPIDVVWNAIFERIDQWWMADYRALGDGSTMQFSADKGGALLEISPNGASLEWYRVQMCEPGKSLYLVGYLAPDWGGPTTSMLKLALKAEDDCSILTVSDALLGNVTQNKANSAQDGWKDLFGSGLKGCVES